MYNKLAEKSREFRLLTLQPGQGQDLLVCFLSTASLQKGPCPSYETISYHWGGSAPTQRRDSCQSQVVQEETVVEISGIRTKVPLRAAQALRCMRLREAPRTLWIDSICINQHDLQEREQQISVMGEIYRGAAGNLIHLGNGDEEEALRGVRSLDKAYQRLQYELSLLSNDAQFRWKVHRIKPDGWGKIEKPPILCDDPRPIQRMFHCTWFTRLWIVQETCLASTNLCHWANQTFDLQHLMDVVHISRELEVAGDAGDLLMFKTYCCIQQLRYPLLLSQQFRSETIDNTREALMMLVDMSRHCDVRHEHDRIFGIAGLLRTIRSSSQWAKKLLEVDYQKPRIDVFRDATRAILLLSRTDDLLTKVTHRTTLELIDPEKPSWSFYWDRPMDLVHEAGRTTLCTDFHAGSQHEDCQLPTSLAVAGAGTEPSILSLRGILLGQIVIFQPPKHGVYHTDLSAANELFDSTIRLARAAPQKDQAQASIDAASSQGESARTLGAEALRLRELDRAHEVIRRRLSRKIGDLEIQAYNESGPPTPSEQHEPSAVGIRPPEDCIDLDIITVLSAGWCAAQFPNAQSSLRTFREMCTHMQHLREPPRLLSDAFNMYMMLCSSSNNRSFFTTHFGDVGCGPKIAETGDVVAVFRGARYPYVLRPAATEEGTYRLVGMAIIPAIMHGEVFTRGLGEQDVRLC